MAAANDARAVCEACSAAEPAAALVALLDERSSRYAGRSTADAERLRGLALAALEDHPLQPAAVPFVLEELESGRNPSNVAAAGRALRGWTRELPGEAATLVVQAIERLRASDDAVRFGGPGERPTALLDLAETLCQLGPAARGAAAPLQQLLAAHGAEYSFVVRRRLQAALARVDAGAVDVSEASCCSSASPRPPAAAPIMAQSAGARNLGALLLEDQDGVKHTFGERFSGRPSLLAFFYTRCTNPERCSLTVTQLAEVDRRLREAGIDANVAGLSYDPGYDLAPRLRAFGVERGMQFSPRCSLLRTIGPVGPLVDGFGLAVGFGPVTVNQHALDLVLLGTDLEVIGRRQRRSWGSAEMIGELAAVAGANVPSASSR